MTCNPTLTKGHTYIVIEVDNFMKWVEAMPNFNNDGETITLFLFNHIISRFSIPRDIFIDHGYHFHNNMMFELALKLVFRKEHSSPYYA